LHRLVAFEVVAGIIAVIGGVTVAVMTARDRRPGAPPAEAFFHHVIVADSEDDPRAARLANHVAGVQWFDEGEEADSAAAAPVARPGRSRRRPWPARRDAAARAARAETARRRSAS
jgi:hypothetical protein